MFCPVQRGMFFYNLEEYGFLEPYKEEISIVKGKKIVIAGGTGFIGSHLIKQLKMGDYDIYVLTRKCTSI